MKTLPRRVLTHLFRAFLLSYLCMSIFSLAHAQGAWPPSRVNGDPNNPNRFSSNGKWYTLTYVSTANNGTPQSITPAYVNIGYSYEDPFEPLAILSAVINGRSISLPYNLSSAQAIIDKTGTNSISTNANNGTGGLDRYLEFNTYVSGGSNTHPPNPVYAYLQVSSSPAPWITYKVTCETVPNASFGVTVRIAHGAFAYAKGSVKPGGGSVQAYSTADNQAASVMFSTPGTQTNGSLTLQKTGNSQSYTCQLSNGGGYFAVPLTTPSTSINTATNGGPPTEGWAQARHDITPIEVIGP